MRMMNCMIPIVIENREKGADENDGGQHLKGENESDARTLLAQSAENKFRTHESIAEHAVGGVTGCLEHSPAKVDAQHEDREHKLQAQSPRHGLHANGAPVGGKHVRQSQHGEKAKNSGVTSHSVLSVLADQAMNQRSFLRGRRI